MRRATVYPTIVLSCAIAVLSTACASVPARSTSRSLERAADINEPARYGRSSDVLTSAELLDAHAVTTSAGVRQLRPSFLKGSRSMTVDGVVDVSPSVYLNGGDLGGIDELESVSLDAVQEIRFIRPAQAHDFWGAWCPCNGGVIHVRTKRAD